MVGVSLMELWIVIIVSGFLDSCALEMMIWIFSLAIRIRRMGDLLKIKDHGWGGLKSKSKPWLWCYKGCLGKEKLKNYTILIYMGGILYTDYMSIEIRN